MDAVEKTMDGETGGQERPRRGVGWWVRKAAKLFVIALVVVMGLLWMGQRFLVFPGAYVSHGVSDELPDGVELLTRETDEGVVEAWVLPGRGASASRPGPGVVFFHGNGELINIWRQEMRWYTDRGYTVLLPEYRGYGRSEGSPSAVEIIEDAVYFYDQLAAMPTVDAERIVFHGRSLGGGVAAGVAEQRPPCAMILTSTFTSVHDAALGMVPVPGFMIRDKLEVESVLQKLAGPVLILHGELDQVVSVEMAKRNAEAAKNATLVIYPGVNHNDMPYGHGDWDDILRFLDQAGLSHEVVVEEAQGEARGE